MPRQVALVVALALGLFGCGDPPPPAADPLADPQTPRPQEATPPSLTARPSTPPDSACRVTPLATIVAPERVQRLTLLTGAAQPAPGTEGLSLLVETATTELVRLTPEFGVRTRRPLEVRIEAAVSTGAGIVALVAGPAGPTGAAQYRVLQLGETAASDTELQLPVPVHAVGAFRRNTAAGQVVFTWTDGRQPPLALRVLTSPGQAPRFDAAYALSPEVDLDDARAVQLLRVALDDTSFAAIVREGAAEGADSQVWLARPSGPVPVPALEDVADIESLAIVGDQVWAIATLEFSRPLLFRILPTGQLDGPPEELARDATLPAPLPSGDPARLLVEGDRLLLRRRNAMGDPLLPDAVVATRTSATLPADVLRDGARYVVVYQDRDEAGGSWPIRFASLDCAQP
ncbi:MAG: hypothetical protein IPG17_02000 [Sandaracinaceae bacterium]|nr:hypothetical protein [Sandaracinaceae bacterium]